MNQSLLPLFSNNLGEAIVEHVWAWLSLSTPKLNKVGQILQQLYQNITTTIPKYTICIVECVKVADFMTIVIHRKRTNYTSFAPVL